MVAIACLVCYGWDDLVINIFVPYDLRVASSLTLSRLLPIASIITPSTLVFDLTEGACFMDLQCFRAAWY